MSSLQIWICIKNQFSKTQSQILIEIYTFDKLEGKKHWKEILEIADESLRDRLNQIKESVKSDDLATIIYTSGYYRNSKRCDAFSQKYFE